MYTSPNAEQMHNAISVFKVLECTRPNALEEQELLLSFKPCTEMCDIRYSKNFYIAGYESQEEIVEKKWDLYSACFSALLYTAEHESIDEQSINAPS